MLLRCLLKLLLDVSSDSELSDSVRQTLMDQTALCIKLLDGCYHGNLQVSLPVHCLTSVSLPVCLTLTCLSVRPSVRQFLLRRVDSGCCSAEVLGCLATVTMRTER